MASSLAGNALALQKLDVPQLIDVSAMLKVELLMMGYLLERVLIRRDRLRRHQEVLCEFVTAVLIVETSEYSTFFCQCNQLCVLLVLRMTVSWLVGCLPRLVASTGLLRAAAGSVSQVRNSQLCVPRLVRKILKIEAEGDSLHAACMYVSVCIHIYIYICV